ncbi:PadR family transcriptional regulator [Nocardioides sp.]|uniref:PadR family transcriptional regulator n=1 Tax=Nocardioides sp. TaxID=35761 RepID=UPI0026224F95|nr:PadR family transcriptional regulator [Nocardioides sp.]
MSVRNGLLALLSEQPMYGAQLRAEFERRTGDTWPLNIGQVYSTLQRLERDGLVSHVHGDHGEVEDTKTIPYALTEDGQAEVSHWWASATPTVADPRDELTIKLALAVTVPGVEAATLVQRQRTAALAHLQELTRAKRSGTDSLAAELVLERRIFDAEALVRWLDHIEGRLMAQPAEHTVRTSSQEIAR